MSVLDWPRRFREWPDHGDLLLGDHAHLSARPEVRVDVRTIPRANLRCAQGYRSTLTRSAVSRPCGDRTR